MAHSHSSRVKARRTGMPRPESTQGLRGPSASAARAEGRAGLGSTLPARLPRARRSPQYLTGDRPTKGARHAAPTPASTRPASAPEVASASARAPGSAQCAGTRSRGVWLLPRCPRYVGVALAMSPWQAWRGGGVTGVGSGSGVSRIQAALPRSGFEATFALAT